MQKLFQSVVNFLPPLKPEDLQNQTEQLGDPQTRATPSPEPINRVRLFFNSLFVIWKQPNMLNESSEIQNDFESQIYQLRSKIKDLEREKNELAEVTLIYSTFLIDNFRKLNNLNLDLVQFMIQLMEEIHLL